MVCGKEEPVLVVGGGCFGISTAYHLLKRGFKNVTVVDRSDVLPAPDAASTDLNKIVRSSYSDSFYSRLAQEAIQSWKAGEWGGTYHESGVLVIGSSSDTSNGAYANKFYENDLAIGSRLAVLKDGEAIRSAFPQGVNVASFEGSSGYLNYDGGWASAAQGVRLMTSNVIARGGKVISGKSVVKLLRQNDRTSGVQFADGTTFDASLVVLATGSWTASSFPDLNLGDKCVATGQSLATIQLTPQEAEIYRDCPVVLDFAAEFYTFPPNEDNIVKFAIHDSGFTHCPVPGNTISSPRTVSSHPQDGLRIPKTRVQELRKRLRRVYPDLAEKPFTSTRLCWYTDSPGDDWVIGYYPSDPSLMMATGGSGHAYKFLPVIGRIVADAAEEHLDPSLAKKFTVDRDCIRVSSLRASAAGELDTDGLCSPEDLLPDDNNT
jgi:sarcosine oxidase/L-pipecolate oxidase